MKKDEVKKDKKNVSTDRFSWDSQDDIIIIKKKDKKIDKKENS